MENKLLEKEIEAIQDDSIKQFTKIALENLPEYFFEVAASSTGKYHPTYALGEGGLVRHTCAAVRFAKHLLQLEQYQNIFNEEERDCIISAILLHDGWKHGIGDSSFTVHEHPQVCADWVVSNEIFKDVLDKEKRKLIASAVASHMGQWNENKRNKIVLQKPVTEIQKFVHICDYLASRKDIEVLFDVPFESKQNVEEYIMPFGKHKGKLLTEIFKSHKDYLIWLQDNTTMKEPLNGFVKTLLQNKGE